MPEVFMRYKANALSVMVFVLLAVGILGCQQGGAEQVSETNEADGETGAKTTNPTQGESTSSEKQGAVARAGDGEAVAKAGDVEARAGNGEARAGNAVAGDGKARAGDVVAGEAEPGNARGRAGRVEVKIGGQPGTQFSGTCVVGEEKQDVSGRVPGRFVFEAGNEVRCEIGSVPSEGTPLKFSVTSGGENKQQRIRATAQNIDFALSGNSVSYEAKSSSGSSVSSSSSSVVQSSKITSSSSSSVSSSSSR